MYSTDVEKAKEYALQKHTGMSDKAGAPYEGHLRRVAGGVDTDETRVIAWLHDTVEDTNATIEEIQENFGEETAAAVECMTHRKDESYDDYLIRAKSNPFSRAVKISDLIDNSNLSRLPQVTLKDVERQAKYNRALRSMLVGDAKPPVCCMFDYFDARSARDAMETELVKRYEDDQYMFDEGGRSLLRCKKCGCLILVQRSEFHGFSDDAIYSDYFPVASVEEADRINAEYGPMNIEECTHERFLRNNDGNLFWMNK